MLNLNLNSSLTLAQRKMKDVQGSCRSYTKDGGDKCKYI